VKFLTYFFDRSDLERHERLFREKGIPTHAESTRGMAMYNKWALHVWIDTQHADAVRLLEDPTHVPENPVDVDAFFEASRETEVNLWQFVSPGALVAIAAAALAVIVAIVNKG